MPFMQAERDRNNSIMAALEEERTAAMAAAQRQVCNAPPSLIHFEAAADALLLLWATLLPLLVYR